jgi:ribosome biogenesis GTPase
VSASTEKGRHTTTTARLYTLAENIRIIDTPGARSLGLWRVSPEELAYYFPEMAELANGCRFRNCTHVHEPACAVRDAVEAGDLPRQRYASYLRIRASL